MLTESDQWAVSKKPATNRQNFPTLMNILSFVSRLYEQSGEVHDALE